MSIGQAFEKSATQPGTFPEENWEKVRLNGSVAGGTVGPRRLPVRRVVPTARYRESPLRFEIRAYRILIRYKPDERG